MRVTSSAGFLWALISAAAFATSGILGTALNQAGWSPGAAVLARVAIGGLILALPAAWLLRGRWGLLRRNIGLIVAYGVVAIAGCQLFYFNALTTLTVGVALLLEYLAIVMVVGWLWIRHRQRPTRLTLAGTVLALAGLVLVLDLVGGSVQIDGAGVLWGLAAAAALAVYFVLSGHVAGGLPPLVLASAGLLVGGVVLAALGVVGVLPMRVTTDDVVLAGRPFAWWVPVLGLAVFAAAIAYTSGIVAVRMLGATLASFVALSEVLCAVLFAWLLLGQLPARVQLLGGALIVAGVVLVRLSELRRARRHRPAARSS